MWKMLLPEADLAPFVSLADVGELFSIHPRTAAVWLQRWADAPGYVVRLAYKPRWARRRRGKRTKWQRDVVRPHVLVHIQDVIHMAKADGFTIPQELADEIAGRVSVEDVRIREEQKRDREARGRG